MSKKIKWIIFVGAILVLMRCTYLFLEQDYCMDTVGGAWDSKQNVCRFDCLAITEGFGCIKMTDEQVKLFEDCRYKGADCIPDSVYDEICKNNDLPINKVTGECDTEFSPKKCSEYGSDWQLPKICK